MKENLRILIVEDEGPAAEKLERYLLRYQPSLKVVARLAAVSDSVEWLRTHQQEVDLIFMDIQLLDGLSFRIFEQVRVERPVIFVTAFNEYALEAFKANGIDYLLKPITYPDLTASLDKYDRLRDQFASNAGKIMAMQQSLSSGVPVYKKRFMVKLGEHIRSVTSDQIGLLYADGREVYLITGDNRKFIVDYTLEALEEVLDPAQFFRVNRSYMVSIHHVQDVMVYSNSRLRITPTVKWDQEIIVSREKVADFKHWFDGNN